MLTRDDDIRIFYLLYNFMNYGTWTEKDQRDFELIDKKIQNDNPAKYTTGRINIFLDVFGKVEFLKKYCNRVGWKEDDS